MAMQHTPGPWKIRWYPQSHSAEIENDDLSNYRHITNMLPMCAGPDVPVELILDTGDPEKREYRYSAESCANARLIAAAPDLLDLVRRMNHAFYVDGTAKAMKPIMAESKALIALAQGDAA